MNHGEILDNLFDVKKINILRFFLANPGKQFYLKEISDNVNVPIATTHRILKLLVKLEIIIETKISKLKI